VQKNNLVWPIVYSRRGKIPFERGKIPFEVGKCLPPWARKIDLENVVVIVSRNERQPREAIIVIFGPPSYHAAVWYCT